VALLRISLQPGTDVLTRVYDVLRLVGVSDFGLSVLTISLIHRTLGEDCEFAIG